MATTLYENNDEVQTNRTLNPRNMEIFVTDYGDADPAKIAKDMWHALVTCFKGEHNIKNYTCVRCENTIHFFVVLRPANPSIRPETFKSFLNINEDYDIEIYKMPLETLYSEFVDLSKEKDFQIVDPKKF
jgi:hypothetical protein